MSDDPAAPVQVRAPATRARPASVAEVVPGRIFALGGVVPADRPMSFYPRSEGWLPIMAYVVRDRGSMLLIDTGVASHAREIRAALTALTEGCTERRACLTRRELDCMINLDWILRDFGFQTFHFGGDVGVCPLDFFVHPDASKLTPRVHMTATDGFVIGGLRVETVRTSLRLLATNWHYEPDSRTLFTSDVWGFLTLKRPDDPWVVRPEPRDITVERITEVLLAKFDWLRGADCATILGELERLRAGRVVDRLCPGYGCIIEGRAAVERVFDRTVEALHGLAAAPRRSELTGWKGREAVAP